MQHDEACRRQSHRRASERGRLVSCARVSVRDVSAEPGSYLPRPKGYFGRVTEIAANICQIMRCVMTIRPVRQDRLSDEQRFTSRARVGKRSQRAVQGTARTRTTARRDVRRPVARTGTPQNPRRKSSSTNDRKLSPAFGHRFFVDMFRDYPFSQKPDLFSGSAGGLLAPSSRKNLCVREERKNYLPDHEDFTHSQQCSAPGDG